MLTGSRRLRLGLSGFGDDAMEIVSAFPFKLFIEGFPVIIDGVKLGTEDTINKFSISAKN